jgi:putative FmdB family regulatory protein
VPTYEYRCRDCGEHIEVVQSFTDEPLTTCGACNGSLRKVFSSIGVTFKGSGFYRTDSRAAASKKSESKTEPKTDTTSTSSEGSSGGSGTSESSTKSDAKPEAKTAKTA